MKRIIKRITIAAAILFAAFVVLGLLMHHFETPAQRAADEQRAIARAEERKREEAADAAKQAARAEERKQQDAADAAKRAARDTENRIEHERFMAERAARDFVLARLKAPSTAKFGDDAAVKDRGNGTYDVTSYVDSQNAFGAMIRTKYICTVKTSDGGDHFRLVEFFKY